VWTTELDKRLFALRERGWSFAQIAAGLSLETGQTFTKDQIQKRYRRVRRGLQLAPAPRTRLMPYFSLLFDETGQPRREPTKLDLDAALAPLLERRMRILVISDLHVSQHDEDLLVAVLNRHRDADLIVVNGDALDIYAYSRYQKYHNRPIEQEIDDWCRIQLTYLAAWPLVLITDSNHAQRVPRAAVVPDGLRFLLEPNVMRHLARPFSTILALDEWYVQIGDAIIAHGDYATRRVPRAAEQVAAWFRKRVGSEQFPHLRPFRVLVQAHTHRVGCVVTAGTKVIESGCLARLPLDYTTRAHQVRYDEPHANGYVELVLDRGRAVLNECREYYLEAADVRRGA
jgi:hypothetical protein